MTLMWPLGWGAECQILKQPYKQYRRTVNSSSSHRCTDGINKVCTMKQISSQWYKTAQPVFTVKLRNPFENIIFTSYVTYLTVTISIIHTQHYSNDINSDVYSKGKGDSSISKTNKTKCTCQKYLWCFYEEKRLRENGLTICNGICYISPIRAW